MDLTLDWAVMSHMEEVFFLGTLPLHHSPNLTAFWLATCSLTTPPTNPPTPSREPCEAESHHHGDLNTVPSHTGPLWLACVEVRGKKMSQQQVFLCFCFCLNSRWDCAQIHALSYTAGTAGATVVVSGTSWLEKYTQWHGSTLYKWINACLFSFFLWSRLASGQEHKGSVIVIIWLKVFANSANSIAQSKKKKQILSGF